MSAIVGIYFPDGRFVDRAALDGMLATHAHRSLNGTSVWHEGSVGLGHGMLWTTQESLTEKIPVVNHAGEVVLTADARIDNREELITTLDLTHCPASEIADSQLILAAYERWDEHCLERLLGDFAFSIWDGRRQRLFCARDHLGVKPFYYYQSDRVFVFASEIKAILSLSEVPRQLNETRIADHLEGLFEDRAITFYHNIFRLPAAHSLTVSREGTHLRPYWRLNPHRELRLASDEEYAEGFRVLFTEAVRCRLRSAFPVGSLLSGGLDSSSIVCTARYLRAKDKEEPLQTFSAIFPSLPEADLRRIDERLFIDTVVAMGGVEPHYVLADRLSPLADLNRVLWHEDEAIFAPNLYLHWALYGAAEQQNVRVLLDGIDGDTTVSHGLEYLAELTRRGRWKTLLTEAMALSRKSSAAFPARRIVWQYGLKPLLAKPSLHVRWLLGGQSHPMRAADSIINADFARRMGVAERARAAFNSESHTARHARSMHWRGLTSGLVPAALEMADRAAAAFALEPRYPFFDRRMIEFCLAVPPEQKLHQGWTRVIMRRAMANIVPDAVRWRIGKANLSPNFQRRLLDLDRRHLDKIILNRPQVLEPYVNMPALRGAYHRFTTQPTAMDAILVYGVAILALWLDQANLPPQSG